MNIGESMDATTPLWAFNVSLILLLGWLYHYFWTMFNAIAHLNDSLIGLMTKSNDRQEEDKSQTTLNEFFPEEE